jgi:polyisoprenyl-teichoic acid--peptidoglycan teichoic acid transferase
MTRSAASPDDGQAEAQGAARRRRRQAWALQGLGVLVALVGLAGFWLGRDVDRSPLTELQREILGVREGDFTVSFVVAGKDRFFAAGLSEPIYGAGGAIVGWRYRGRPDADGTNTDTILYVQVVNDEVTMIAIPRDLYLDQWQAPVNAMYFYQGADGLRRTVEDVLGLPVDYYVVINLDIFKGVVDALGGVDVNVPYDMRYRDIAGGLDIDLRAGPQRLDGKGAADFVRFRQTVRGDFDRLDRVKTLAYAILARLRDLNVRAVTRLPELTDTFFKDVETNATPALVSALLPRLPRLQIRAATLPVVESETTSRLGLDRAAVEGFLASTFGGTSRSFAEAPPALLQIVDRSGREGLGASYRDRLLTMGVPEDRIVVSTASVDPAASRVVATFSHWLDAEYYATLFGVGSHTIDRLPSVSGRPVGIQLVLGGDARPPGLDLPLLAERASVSVRAVSPTADTP